MEVVLGRGFVEQQAIRPTCKRECHEQEKVMNAMSPPRDPLVITRPTARRQEALRRVTKAVTRTPPGRGTRRSPAYGGFRPMQQAEGTRTATGPPVPAPPPPPPEHPSMQSSGRVPGDPPSKDGNDADDTEWWYVVILGNWGA